jgi:hypothetical protein
MVTYLAPHVMLLRVVATEPRCGSTQASPSLPGSRAVVR